MGPFSFDTEGFVFLLSNFEHFCLNYDNVDFLECIIGLVSNEFSNRVYIEINLIDWDC